MTEKTRPQQLFPGANAGGSDGDCEADPVPALWDQDDDDMYTESGIIDRFWLPISVAVLAGWVSVSYILVNAFGWIVILAIVGVVVAGVSAAVVLIRTGERGDIDIVEVSPAHSHQDAEYRKAA